MDSTSCSYELLVTHSRFADVYTLFEDILKLLPEKTVKEFMQDVKDMRTKLDTWKTLFTYEREKKTFLVEKCRTRSTSESQSARDSKDASSQNGSSFNGSESFSPSMSRPPSEQRRSTFMNNAPTLEETLDATLPLELENDNDETWLISPPPAPIPSRNSIHDVPIQNLKMVENSMDTLEKNDNMTKNVTSSPTEIQTVNDWAMLASMKGSTTTSTSTESPPPQQAKMMTAPMTETKSAKLLTTPTRSETPSKKLLTTEKKETKTARIGFLLSKERKNEEKERSMTTSLKESSKPQSRLRRFLRKPKKTSSPSLVDEMVLRTASTTGQRTRIPRPPLSPNRSGRFRRGSSVERN